MLRRQREDTDEHAGHSQQATEFPPFTEEHDMIRRTVRRFAEEEIQPHAEKWDEEGIFPREIFRKAGDLGLFGIRIDPKWGGAGLDWWASTAYYEGMAFSDSGSVNMALMVQSDLTIPVIQELGTEDQKAGIHSARGSRRVDRIARHQRTGRR